MKTKADEITNPTCKNMWISERVAQVDLLFFPIEEAIKIAEEEWNKNASNQVPR